MTMKKTPRFKQVNLNGFLVIQGKYRNVANLAYSVSFAGKFLDSEVYWINFYEF